MQSINHLLENVTFTAHEYGKIRCTMPQPNAPLSPSLFADVEDVIALEAMGAFGSFHFNELKNENFCIRHDQFNLLEDIRLTTHADTQSLGLHYVLKNNIRSIVKGLQEDVMCKNQYNMIYVPSVESEYLFQKEQEYINFGVVFTPDYLERCGDAFPFLFEFLKQISQKVPAMLREKHPSITPEMTLAIQSILHCSYAGTLKKMYLDSKVPELLLLSLQNFPGSTDPKVKLNRTDIQKIHDAKEYLLTHMDSPCSIKELAHEVGLNDFKIKNGFKEIYKNTVFGVFMEERMQRARTLLLETDMSVLDISILTGYKNLSNFTASFKRKFGYPPSALKR